MSKNFHPIIVQYSAKGLPDTLGCRFVSSFTYMESNQDVAWFNSHQYKDEGLFGIKRSLDKKNKLLAIVKLEYKGRKIRRRYMTDQSLGLSDHQVGLTSESVRILFDDMSNVSKEKIIVSKGNLWDTIMFYWNHPFHATRISFKVGLPSLVISLISLIIALQSI